MGMLDDIIGPLKPQTVNEFMESIQPSEEITKSTRNLIGSVLTGAAVAPTVVPAAAGAAVEVVGYKGAIVAGVVPAGLNKMGKLGSGIRSLPSKVKKKMHDLFFDEHSAV